MEAEKHMIHLFDFEHNEKELPQTICHALKPYFGDKAPEIKIMGRPHKYEAYFEVEPTIGTTAFTQLPNSWLSKQ
jgi:hypothetical protein